MNDDGLGEREGLVQLTTLHEDGGESGACPREFRMVQRVFRVPRAESLGDLERPAVLGLRAKEVAQVRRTRHSKGVSRLDVPQDQVSLERLVVRSGRRQEVQVSVLIGDLATKLQRP